jgi:hypothetical protein
MAPETCGGRRHRTKKHKRHSRRRYTRGGFTAPSMSGVERTGSGNIAVWEGTGVSGSQPVVSGYNAAPSTMSGYSGGRRRRGRKTRRHRRRSMRGGSDGSRVLSGFAGESVGGTAPGSAVYGAVYTGVQPS